MSFCLHFVYIEHTHHEFTFFSLFLLQCFVDDWDDHFTQWQGTATALGCGTLHEPERMKSLVSLILVSSCLGKWKSAVCKIHSNDNYSYRMYCLSSKTHMQIKVLLKWVWIRWLISSSTWYFLGVNVNFVTSDILNYPVPGNANWQVMYFNNCVDIK